MEGQPGGFPPPGILLPMSTVHLMGMPAPPGIGFAMSGAQVADILGTRVSYAQAGESARADAWGATGAAARTWAERAQISPWEQPKYSQQHRDSQPDPWDKGHGDRNREDNSPETWERTDGERKRKSRERDRRDRSSERRRGGREGSSDQSDSPDREKDRSRSRRKRRRRRRSRSRSHSRSYSRSRSRTRSRTRSRSRSRDRSRDRHHRRREDDDYSRFPEEEPKILPPNHTVMVRRLESEHSENDIRQDIMRVGLVPKDIRLIRRSRPDPSGRAGASRGFAFVEFNTVQEAVTWMEARQGTLVFDDGSRAFLQYSIPKDAPMERRSQYDWHCFKCGAHNFRRREHCYKCQTSKREAGGDGIDEVSPHPTHTILLRNLDPLTTEDGVLESLKNVSNMPIRSVRIGRDPLTSASRGICYLELNSVVDSMHLFNDLSTDPPMIDGRQASVSYARLPQLGGSGGMGGLGAGKGKALSSLATSALAAAQWTNQLPTYNPSDPSSLRSMAEYSASLYASNPDEYAAYVQYYELYFQQQVDAGLTISVPNQLDSSADADAAVKKALKDQKKQGSKEGSEKSGAIGPQLPSGFDPNKKYPVPDVSKYQYEELSGYYFDPLTRLYYDANTQYYYNSTTQQYLYWDGTKQMYLPVQGSTDASGGKDDKGDDKKRKEEPKKVEKVQHAKKIAKDMERWAKMLNQKKESAKHAKEVALAQQMAAISAKTGSADAGFAVLQGKSTVDTLTSMSSTPLSILANESRPSTASAPAGGGGEKALVASYGGGSDSEGEDSIEAVDEKFTDYSKMACLLCKRQFPSKDALRRHQSLSDLHRQNLEQYFQSKGHDGIPQKYRDRAAERRLKYGGSSN